MRFGKQESQNVAYGHASGSCKAVTLSNKSRCTTRTKIAERARTVVNNFRASGLDTLDVVALVSYG